MSFKTNLYLKLLGDFIVSKIDKGDKFDFKLVYLNNFLVIKGKTSSNKILDISEIISEFKNKHNEELPKNLNLNTIDLIEYEKEIDYIKPISIIIIN